MIKKNKILYSFFLQLMILTIVSVSCSRDDEFMKYGGDEDFEEGEVRFSVDMVSTRVATDATFNTVFQTGDAIGIFAVKRTDNSVVAYPEASGNYATNLKWVRQADGKWLPAGAEHKLYYANDGKLLDFYAYYPYDPNATDPTNISFSVKNRQIVEEQYNESDLMTARNTAGASIVNASTPVSLQFNHKMAMMHVEVTLKEQSIASMISSDLVVMLAGFKSEVMLDLSTPNANEEIAGAYGDNVNISLCRVEKESDNNYHTKFTYRALVPPQSKDVGDKLFEISQYTFFNSYMVGSGGLDLISGNISRSWIEIPVLIATVPIPAGSFMMGSAPNEKNRNATLERQRLIYLTKNYRMGQYEVTNGQFLTFLNEVGVLSDRYYMTAKYGRQMVITPAATQFQFQNGEWICTKPIDLPVTGVTVSGATEFARWVGGRLPTEAEWEYAARGHYEGKSFLEYTDPFGVGDCVSINHGFATFRWTYPYIEGIGERIDNNVPTVPSEARAVGIFAPNNYGLYDMHGNVREIVSDIYSAIYIMSDVINPQGPTGNMASYRAVRGGSFLNTSKDIRSASRTSFIFTSADRMTGFRVVYDME